MSTLAVVHKGYTIYYRENDNSWALSSDSVIANTKSFKSLTEARKWVDKKGRRPLTNPIHVSHEYGGNFCEGYIIDLDGDKAKIKYIDDRKAFAKTRTVLLGISPVYLVDSWHDELHLISNLETLIANTRGQIAALKNKMSPLDVSACRKLL